MAAASCAACHRRVSMKQVLWWMSVSAEETTMMSLGISDQRLPSPSWLERSSVVICQMAAARSVAVRIGPSQPARPGRYEVDAPRCPRRDPEALLAAIASGPFNGLTNRQSGRIEARTGLRMMPTFPRSSLSFRTAGFPQYGWKAGFPSGAFPDNQSA